VCREGFEERSKGEARDIVNQQDRRTDLEVGAWIFVALYYSSGGPLSQEGSP
jgi:hypothetical protein